MSAKRVAGPGGPVVTARARQADTVQANAGQANTGQADTGRADTASDDTLLLLYARGDRAAAQELTDRMLPRALAVAQRVLGDRAEAEDIAQEAMVRLWRMAPDWQAGQAKLSTWLYRVVMNLCIDLRRKRRGGAALDDVPEPADAAPSVAEQMQNKARMDALQAALMTLPDRQRQAVVLRHLEELNNPEIAQILGVSVEAVESLTARGKRGLAKALKQRRNELGYADG